MFRYLASSGAVFALTLTCGVSMVRAQSLESDQLPNTYVPYTQAITLDGGDSSAAGGKLSRHSNAGVLGVDSLTNWSSYFYLPGADSNGFTQFTWQYTMIGNSPFNSGDGDNDGDDRLTTLIPAPIVPVTMDLRNADGTPRFVNGQPLVSASTQYVVPVLKSPAFSNTSYSSSHAPTQFTDALQRAEFFRSADPAWHTLLAPRVLPARTMTLLRGTYRFALNNDGTCCAYILVDEGAFINALFPPTATDTTTVMGAVENAHQITTQDLASFLFNNVFLYSNGDPTQCCILGFHSYDLEPGSAANGWREKRYVMDYASWISPGLFGPSFTDVTALSHELSEAFNDPFVNNATPWWLAPNGLCQNNLETGDVIEGLPNATFPITLNGFTYHPQNEALIQWFADVTPSNAISHAYSYPDITVLTTPNTPQPVNCGQPTTSASK